MRYQKSIRLSGGFTLIELMIVIAIVTILATMALPSFQDRIIKSQVKEAIDLARIATTAVDAYYIKKQRFPASNADAGLPESDKIIGHFVHQVEIIDGTVNITLGKRANNHIIGKILSMRPAIVEGEPIVPIAWVCGNAQAPDGMLVLGNNVTSLENIHLPLDCRQILSTQ